MQGKITPSSILNHRGNSLTIQKVSPECMMSIGFENPSTGNEAVLRVLKTPLFHQTREMIPVEFSASVLACLDLTGEGLHDGYYGGP